MPIRLFALSSCALLGMTLYAAAQTSRPGPDPDDPYITSTGETVDKPGQSQSGGTTALDRQIQRENNQIDKSICRGC